MLAFLRTRQTKTTLYNYIFLFVLLLRQDLSSDANNDVNKAVVI